MRLTNEAKNIKEIFSFKIIYFHIGASKWYFVTIIVLTYCEKKLFWSSRKLMKFKSEGQEFAKSLRSLEQFIQTVKGQNNLW